MPAITATSMSGSAMRALTTTTLNGTDSLTYAPGDILILLNPTGSSITPTIDGSDNTPWFVPGFGLRDISAGLSLGAITAGVTITVPLDSIRAFLQGTITITSGSGLVGSLMRN